MSTLKTLFTLAIVLVSHLSFSGQKEEEAMPTIMLESTEVDTSLLNSEAKYIFTFRNLGMDGKAGSTQYSIDGVTHIGALADGKTLTVITTPGNHIFQFYYSMNYYEVYTDSLSISAGYVSNYSIYLQEAEMPVLTQKPIIYLYPEVDTAVSVKLKVKGKLTFTYPEYKDGWKFKASPNGDLTFGENTYNYLFWESSQRRVLHSNTYASGYIVKGENATSFLKGKLTEAGLNSKEQTDFITYWAPRLAQNDLNYVRFDFNESCNQYAELDIEPKPDHIYRIYMLWHPTKLTHEPKPQDIPKVNREGFTVIEWGGQELPNYMN
ncbi:MAG: hypothetical protein HRT57_00235 [Crocinitomicaceae bacterium]|nr:hypothetical protein [Crocinitomicaceae bacterium]